MFDDLKQKKNWVTIGLVALVNFTCPAPSVAREPHLHTAQHGERWTGVAATSESWYSYGGITYSPFDHIHNEGIRLRAAGGYGQYYYDSTLNIDGENVPVSFMGETGAVEAMIGYQLRAGAWTGKFFAGLQYEEHYIQPFDPGNEIDGVDWGLKLAVENWFNIGDKGWAALDANYATGFQTYGAELRGGYNLVGPIDLGALVGIFGNETLDAGRAGLLIRYRDDVREITLRGGVSGDYDAPSNPFGSITMLTAF